jgi:hypothetical protein
MLDQALPTATQNYPLLNLFWTMFWLFLWMLWLFLLIRVAIDIFRSDDLSGWAKAGWLIFVIFLPYLGVLVYVIVRSDEMQRHEGVNVQASEGRRHSTPAAPAAPANTADELTKLATLRDNGVLTDAEFASQKAALLR